MHRLATDDGWIDTHCYINLHSTNNFSISSVKRTLARIRKRRKRSNDYNRWTLIRLTGKAPKIFAIPVGISVEHSMTTRARTTLSVCILDISRIEARPHFDGCRTKTVKIVNAIEL